ncbi:MAG: 2,3,4,5-tetrahydropyridine-2,6-dicarboxylate N-succinyltransferase [Spirochaetes bacterium]|nr:2,3,4,5-tetrahydropyridine-2,6-dicarboxylate N-succinyltransferase [Spirochaetota bacterium]
MDGERSRLLKARFAETGAFDPKEWEDFLSALESGELAATSRNAEGNWQAVTWVKKAILSGFKAGGAVAWDWPGGAVDRPAFPPRRFGLIDGVRIVPGGSSARRGAYLAPGVVVMPPSYINVGAYIGAGTMVDSHVLVGSCARIGEGVHLSAGAQIGGVLEPPQARPVVIEDGVFVGGLCGIFEGIVVCRNAVLAPGLILSGSTPIFDLTLEKQWTGVVPENAVVVPGARPAKGMFAQAGGLSLQAPIIVKYRDSGTDASVSLEAALR